MHRQATSTQPPASLCRQQGLTLIEVLVAVVILSIGLLGLAGMQAYSLQNNTSAYQTSHATIAAGAILDAMRADRDNALNGDYDLGFGQSAANFQGDDSFIGRTMRDWLRELEQALPGIANDNQQGASIVVNNGVATIQIRWNDERWNQEADNQDETRRTVELVSRI